MTATVSAKAAELEISNETAIDLINDFICFPPNTYFFGKSLFDDNAEQEIIISHHCKIIVKSQEN